ncbi:DUF167 domain-containing protein [Tardiphaga sp. vice352]|uniref:DUF167 domain-containing protein n=1 Tax=unclassified Tardiphaga TaxID=2631404 RepID=UPI0011627B59|nr:MULTISPECIES: DUF167 domain-containing protein [unclassified Tardiphaga]QDM20138.1 DUF167 domain-containing protein [Tardiphaga sp. vice154]QDM25209.1 DUF167 domain-containing protein [Tardiphaga sp. vice304]QDM30420.1 DUF167 domain-containing protein [Tardiphaga sp. vice352]
MADPWRYSADGISIALRVTPRGGRDDIDGIETLSDGRPVVKVRVRAIAEGGEANRAVTDLLAKVLGVRKRDVRVLSGTTSRQKQVAVDGDPRKLGELLRSITAAKPAKSSEQDPT